VLLTARPGGCQDVWQATPQVLSMHVECRIALTQDPIAQGA